MKQEEMKISELYDLTQTMAAELMEAYTYPWEVLAHIGDFVKKLGASLSPDEYEKRGEDVWIHKTAKVAPTASITGPGQERSFAIALFCGARLS